ncbi:MAG TPA: GTP 3',8-cyclase MoaA [Cyanobacteria bacterium UBA8156]|jgi:cyclic pyranopterin phosphate synthase|nr:GTP 3',8-cyclase MoaA [Cyanobacteria bacterium UBA8156]
MPFVDYLRISLIDRCHYRCTYCVPADGVEPASPLPELLTHGELVTLVRDVFVPLGFRKFRLTGGEPLLRADTVDIVRSLAALPGVQDLALTTNGDRLAPLAEPLYQAGLRRLNISLDSLNPDTFQKITGRDRWQRVWNGILAAAAVGFAPLKLNVVVIPGINDQEVPALAALTLDRPWHVRFIEFMPIGNETLFGEKGWVDSATLRQQLQDQFGLEPATCQGNGPADVFRLRDAQGTVGFISQMSECFCDRCNRLRLSADGWLRPCLLNEVGQQNLKTWLRGGADPILLQATVAQLLQDKTNIHFKDRERGGDRYTRTMARIGG